MVISLIINYLITAQHLLLGLYTLPTIFSAYYFGKRHAMLTALASLSLVVLLAYFNPKLFKVMKTGSCFKDRWCDITAWGGILVLTAYAMGSLYERHDKRLRELRQAYHGVLHILRYFVSKDKYTENHSYRVSIYAAEIASHMGLSEEQIEDVRAASLIHDIASWRLAGKFSIRRNALPAKSSRK